MMRCVVLAAVPLATAILCSCASQAPAPAALDCAVDAERPPPAAEPPFLGVDPVLAGLATHVVTRSQRTGVLHAGYYESGCRAFLFRTTAKGVNGRVFAWHPGGQIYRIEMYGDGRLIQGEAWDEEGRMLNANWALWRSHPWNPGRLDNPPPPPETIERWVEELLEAGLESTRGRRGVSTPRW
jgi:hypothetical protein